MIYDPQRPTIPERPRPPAIPEVPYRPQPGFPERTPPFPR